MSHALLSPSGASRWLQCTPSARLETQFPYKENDAAKEGTLAHKLGEALIRYKAKLISKVAFNKILAEVQADKFYDNSMLEYCEDYAVFVMERFAAAQARTKDAKIFVETKLNMSEYVPEGFGTGDVNIVADHILDFIDLKYGKGVEVSAIENKQMMLYALGALNEYDFLFDITKVRMTIYQPRIDNISEWEIYVADLRKWAQEELKPRAALAFKGEGEFIVGKHCQFCRARPMCKAHGEKQLEILQYEFKAGLLLEDHEVSDILKRSKDLTSWLKEVNDFALSEAVLNGKKWPDHKLVEGRSNRIYSDEAAVAEKLIAAGFKEEIIYAPKELLGITAMEKSITKKVFEAQLAELIVKPAGKPALVPLDDKRPEMNSIEKVTSEFDELVETN
jgi:hypothetical protein